MSEFTLDFAISSDTGESQGETGNLGGSRTPARFVKTFVVPLSRETEAIETMRGKAEANGWTIWDSALDNEYTATKFGVDGVGMSLRIYTEGPVEPTPERERTDDTPVTVALSLSTRG